MKRIKHLFFLPIFLYFLNLQAGVPLNQLTVYLYKGEISSVCLSTDTILTSVTIAVAQKLIDGTISKYYVGDLTMYIYNNKLATPYTLMFTSSTYDTLTNTYYAANLTNKISIGVEKNFDINGNLTAFNSIDSSTNPVVIRSSTTVINEYHDLRIYILNSPYTEFVDGAYTASFNIYFQSP